MAMHSIPWLADLEGLSAFELMLVAFGALMASLAIGFVIDLIMRDAGLGPYADGIIALAGACAGIYLRYRFFASYRADDLYLTVGLVLGTPFLILLALGVAKTRLS
jgi:hypothetical protein